MHAALAALFAGFVAAVICSTIVGNTLVCLAVRRVRKLRQPANALLVSLALADMFVGVAVMPVALVYTLHGEWTMGAALCYLWTSADVTLCTASILNLCAISVDRFLVVSKPLTYAAGGRTIGRIGAYIAVAWCVALVVSASPILFFKTSITGGQCAVTGNFFYQMYATLISFYVPTLVILAVNWRIYRAANRLRKQEELEQCFARATVVGANLAAGVSQMKAGDAAACMNGNGATAVAGAESKDGPASGWLQRGVSGWRDVCTAVWLVARPSAVGKIASERKHRHNKTLKTLGIITGCYIICWLPFFILATYKAIHGYVSGGGGGAKGDQGEPVAAWLDWTCLWLGWINSFINPFIYAKFNREFRVPFKEMLCCRFGTLDTACRSEQYVHDFGGNAQLERKPHEADNCLLHSSVKQDGNDKLDNTSAL